MCQVKLKKIHILRLNSDLRLRNVHLSMLTVQSIRAIRAIRAKLNSIFRT